MTAISWKTGTSGLWSTAADWSTGNVPGGADDVTIAAAPSTAGVAYTVELDSSQGVHSLTLDQALAELLIQSSELSIGTSLTVTAGTIDLYDSTLEGGTYVSSAGTLLITGEGELAGLAADGMLNVMAADSNDEFYLSGVSFAGSGGTGTGSLVLGTGLSTYVDQASVSNVNISLANGALFESELSSAFTLAATSSLSTTGTSNSQSFSFAPYTYVGSYEGAFVNQGTITDSNGSTLTVEGDKLANAGTISVSNGGTVFIDALASSSITNSGLISVGTGSFLEIMTTGAGVFTNSGSLSVNGGTLGLDFNLTNAKLAGYAVSAGTLAILGTLSNTGYTLTVGSAGKIANLLLDGGKISGGIIAAGANFSATGGTLSTVKVEGTLSLTGQGGVTTTGGLTMTGAGGTGAGTIIDHISNFDVVGNTTLSNAAMSIGAPSTSIEAFVYVGSNGEAAGTTLTLAASLAMTQSGGDVELFSDTAQDAILNDGKITAGVSGGGFDAFGLNNAGTITVSNSDDFYMLENLETSTPVNDTNSGTIAISNGVFYYDGLVNTGLISVSGSSSGFYDYSGYSSASDSFANSGTVSLTAGAFASFGFDGSFSNTGTILAAGGTLSLGGTLTSAELGTVKVSGGGVVELAGTLTNSGTLAIGTGTSLTVLTLENTGEISGGTIKDSGQGLGTTQGGTLSGVSYDGTLNLNTPDARVLIVNGLKMASLSGSGAGTILDTGPSANLELLGSQSLTEAVIDIGINPSSQYYYNTDLELEDTSSGAATLTLAATSSIVQTGEYAQIIGTETYSGNDYLPTGDTLINDGSITQTLSGSSLVISAIDLVNAGHLTVANGSSISIQSGTLANSGTIAISGLNKTGSAFAGIYFGGQDGSVSESFTNTGLVTIGTGGVLSLTDVNLTWSNAGTILASGGELLLGGTFTAAQLGTVKASAGGVIGLEGTLTNAGTLSVGTGAALSALTLFSAGTVSGGTLVNAGGGIVAEGGTLSGLTYQGILDLSSAYASLTSAGSLAMENAGGSGAGTMLLTGAYSTLRIAGNDSISNAVIDIGSGSNGSYSQDGVTFQDIGVVPTTLTLAATTSLLQTGQSAYVDGETSYSGGTFTNTGDTLVNDGAITQSLDDTYLNFDALNVVNAGKITIQAGSEIGLGEGTLTNSGTISISGTDASGFDSYLYFNGSSSNESPTAFANTGLVTVGAGGDLDLDGQGNVFAWSNAGQIAVAGGELALGGTFTTTQFGSITVSAGGQILFGTDATDNNTGSTLTIGGTSALGTLSLYGTIHGGVVTDAGSGIVFGSEYINGILTSGDLDAVTYRGTLTLAGIGETAMVTNGITMTGATGTGAGAVALTGAGSTLDFATAEKLSGTALTIGAASDSPTLTGTNLTLASDVIKQIAANATIGTNLGANTTTSTITLSASHITAALSGGTLTLAGDIINTGTIAVSNGETLALDTSSLTNTGTISVSGGLLDVDNATAAQLTEITLSNSPLAVLGTLTATGSTLTVGSGSALPNVELAGTILGGTIHDAGGGVSYYGNTVLNGVTYQGTLSINRPLASVTIVNGLTTTDVTGKLAGSIAITGAGSDLVWDSTQALANATISIGNPGISYEGQTLSAPGLVAGESYNGSSVPVTLAATVQINQTGTYADIGGGGFGGGSIYSGFGTFSSAATMTASIAGGTLSLEGAAFTSSGKIAVSNSDSVTIGAGMFTNAGLISIGAGSALNLNLLNYFESESFAAESFVNTGSIALSGGSIVELTDNGTFPSVPLLNAAGATMSGFGTIQSAIDNNGTITASGGTLSIGQAVTGSGALVVTAGSMLSLSAISSGETASFSGVGGKLGLSPASFLGKIGGFAKGDTIELQSTSATAASFSGTSLVATLSTGATLQLTTTAALTGALTALSDGHGDTLISFATSSVAPVPPILRPDPVPATSSLSDIQPSADLGIPLHSQT